MAYTYLLSPFRRQGTSGSGKTGNDFSGVCQQDSFYLLNTRILHFSERCAVEGKKGGSHKINLHLIFKDCAAKSVDFSSGCLIN